MLSEIYRINQILTLINISYKRIKSRTFQVVYFVINTFIKLQNTKQEHFLQLFQTLSPFKLQEVKSRLNISELNHAGKPQQMNFVLPAKISNTFYDCVTSQCDQGHWLLWMSLTPTERQLSFPTLIEFTLYYKKPCVKYTNTRKNRREGCKRSCVFFLSFQNYKAFIHSVKAGM